MGASCRKMEDGRTEIRNEPPFFILYAYAAESGLTPQQDLCPVKFRGHPSPALGAVQAATCTWLLCAPPFARPHTRPQTAAPLSSPPNPTIFRIDFPFVCVTQPPTPCPSVYPKTAAAEANRQWPLPFKRQRRIHPRSQMRPSVTRLFSPLPNERADGRMKKRRKRSERSLTRASGGAVLRPTHPPLPAPPAALVRCHETELKGEEKRAIRVRR